jgi:hypothetical protein
MKVRSWILTIFAALSALALLVTPAQAGGNRHHRHSWNNGGYTHYNRGWHNHGWYNRGYNYYGPYGYYRPYRYYSAPYSYYRPVYYNPAPVFVFGFGFN